MLFARRVAADGEQDEHEARRPQPGREGLFGACAGGQESGCPLVAVLPSCCAQCLLAIQHPTTTGEARFTAASACGPKASQQEGVRGGASDTADCSKWGCLPVAKSEWLGHRVCELAGTELDEGPDGRADMMRPS